MGAMAAGSSDRYGQDGQSSLKLVPEGIEGMVPYRGSLADNVYQLVGGLQSGMGYCGARTIEAMQQKAHMDAGSSAAKAQTETRSTGEWANHYRAVAQASLTAEKLKKQIMLGQLMFDAERTKQANQRRIV